MLLEERVKPLLKLRNIESEVSDNIVIDLEYGFFIVNTEDGLKFLHTTYADSSLEELRKIEQDEVHKKGFLALESLKEKNPKKYEEQKKWLEFNEMQFWRVYRERINYFEFLTRFSVLFKKPTLPQHLANDLFNLQNVLKTSPSGENLKIFKKSLEAYGLEYNVSSFRNSLSRY